MKSLAVYAIVLSCLMTGLLVFIDWSSGGDDGPIKAPIGKNQTLEELFGQNTFEGSEAAISKSKGYNKDEMELYLTLLRSKLSDKTNVEVQRMEQYIEEYLSKVSSKFFDEFQIWLEGDDVSQTEVWKTNISSHINAFGSSQGMKEAYGLCEDISWLRSLNKGENAEREFQEIEASQFDADRLKRFAQKLDSRIEGLNKSQLFQKQSELKKRSEAFLQFKIKWDGCIDLYKGNYGRNTQRQNYGIDPSLTAKEIRRYAWYRDYWLSTFRDFKGIRDD